MTTIPAQQLTPPAGHHATLAYRPACSQLQSSADPSGVTWFVTLPDGQPYALATGLPAMPEIKAHLWLDAAGLCKVNGVQVPIVAPSEAPPPATRPTVAPQPASGGGLKFSSVVAILLLSKMVIAAAVWVRRRTHTPDPLRSKFLGGRIEH